MSTCTRPKPGAELLSRGDCALVLTSLLLSHLTPWSSTGEAPKELCSTGHYCFANILTVQASPEDYGTELLRRYHENLSEIFTDNQMLLNMIPHLKSLAPGEREVREGTGEGGVK